MSEQLLKYKPYKSNFELSSKWILTKKQRIQIQGKKIFFLAVGGGGGGGGCVCGGGGGGDMNIRAAIFYRQETHWWGGGDMNTRAAIFYRQDTLSWPAPYNLMKIFLTVFKIEGIVALTIKGR